MKTFWARRTKFEKAMLIIIAILLVFGITKSIQIGVIKYQFFKSELKQLEVYKDSLVITKQQLQLKTSELTEVNIKAKQKAISINKKLKSDAEKIDNSTISNNEINTIISKYERLVNNK